MWKRKKMSVAVCNTELENVPKEADLKIRDDIDRPGLSIEYYSNFLDDGIRIELLDFLLKLEYVPRIGFNMKKPETRNYYRWYSDNPGHIYGFSRSHYNSLSPHKWTPQLILIREKVEEKLCKEHGYYNAVLVNYYPISSSNLNKHHDNDAWLEDDPIVASISLGASREFKLSYDRVKGAPILNNNDNGKSISIILESGSLAIMSGETQKYWQHEIKESRINMSIEYRFNLTFRRILEERVYLQPKIRTQSGSAKERELTIIPKESIRQ